MEIERPKLKKKKKTRHQSEDDVESDLQNLSLDIEFPASSIDSVKEDDFKELQKLIEEDKVKSGEISVPSTSKEIQDCKEKEDDLENDEKSQEINENCDIKNEEIFEIENQEPTAPTFEIEEPKVIMPQAIVPQIHSAPILYNETLYPDLNELQSSNSIKITEKILSPIAMKPLSVFEMEQLYSNPQIQWIEMFETEFVEKELRDHSMQDHPLYVLLKKYAKARGKFLVNEKNISRMVKTLDDNYVKVWSIEKKTVGSAGTCSECGKVIFVSHNYDFAMFSEDVNADMTKNLKELIHMSCFNHTKYSQDHELYKRQIEQLIGELMNSKQFSNITKSSPIVLIDEITNRELVKKMSELRLYISILFSFLRHSIHDKVLISNVQDWIKKLVALQLRTATWHDHVFILFQILRCPVNVGNWAANLIQVPISTTEIIESPFALPEFQHCVAILSALLLPVKERGAFLENLTKDLVPKQPSEDAWILVDSDGEEGSSSSGECLGLKENDLVAIFEQIPFESLFELVTIVRTKGDHKFMNEERISGHHIIKSIAFASKFIAILRRGLSTYDSERYKQFAKRLGRLMKHTLAYISDLIQIYRNRDCYKDPEEFHRIQVELDELIIRSSQFIYESKNLSLFQYLADFPYHHMSNKAVWKLFYCLNVGDFKVVEDDIPKLILDESFGIKFNDDVATDDLFFLLHAFSQMALSKGKDDWDFIQFVTLDILQIGFINESTKDFCHNTAEDLLTNITTKYPELIADIFSHLKDNLRKMGSLGSYLFKALPIAKWKPKTEDLEVLASWLLNFDFDAIENINARVIFAYMNWNFDENGQLFLPHEIHLRMAYLVCEVYLKHVGESIGSGVNETARLSGSGKKNLSKKEQFSMWCWSMVSILRLHYMDLSDQVVVNLLNNPMMMNIIPEIEKTHGIYQGLTEQKPLAIYLALLVSQLGHSIPLICHRGFDLLKQLMNDHRHSKVIRCIELMTPLFINCADSLYSCDNFMTILASIFAVDKTYMKIAKELATIESRGPILTFFGNMIQHQILNFHRYGLSSPTDLILMWINCLTRLKEWNKNVGIVWVIDLICQIAYQYPDAWTMTRETLRSLVVRIVDTKIPKTSGLLTLITSEEKDIFMSPLAEGPTISLMLMELEFENIEVNTGLWSEFLCQIVIQGPNLNNVLKRTLSIKQLPSFPLQSLSVYKIAKLIMKIHPKHYLFPVICQQFFSLYMARVPGEISEDDFGVQDKFYDSDISMMKKLKIIFTDSRKLHYDLSKRLMNEGKAQFHSACAKLFETFLYWLEENKLNKMTQERIILPPQYDHPRLKLIFSGNRNHWTEFVDMPELRNTQKSDSNAWSAVCLRFNSTSDALSKKKEIENLTSSEEIRKQLFARLKQNATPQPAPEFVKEAIHIGHVDASKYTLKLLRSESKVLQNFAHKFNLMVNEHKAVDAAYRDSIRLAYINEQSFRMKKATCSRMFDSCQGSITVRLEFSECRKNEHVKNRLVENREHQKKILRKETTSPDPKVVDANFCIANVIDQLMQQYDDHQRRNEVDQCKEILKIGTSYFYEVLADINEEIQSCPVTQELYSDAISKLGTFVQQNHDTEGINLLKFALERPNLVKMIAELFTPSVSSPQQFLKMYQTLVESYAKRREPAFLFVLFSKFDIPKWLQLHKPKLIEVSNLIQLVLRGLELWNMQDSDLLQDLLRCHLVSLFLYRFPEHYGEILQHVLTGFSQQRLKPNVMLDLLNAFYQQVGCKKLDSDISTGRLKDELRNFASKQNVLAYNNVHSTALMFAHHFNNERLQYGLHGLYPKVSEYCDVMSFFMGSIGHSAVASAIQAYPGIMADQLVNWLWPCISEMFGPWLHPYYPQTMKDAPAQWIKQFNANSNVLLPWSEIHAESAAKMIKMFAMCLQYILDMLPASNLLLSHLFCWYDGYYAYKTTPKYVLNPVQSLLIKMPWERFRPGPIHMEGFKRILTDFIPECHLFLGNIFLRINWSQWLQQIMGSWDQTNQKMLAILFVTIVKLSYEPKVRESIRIIQILQESLKYPWFLLEYKDVEAVLDWFVMSAEPSVILKIPSENTSIDNCVINLLETASCMKELPKDAQNIQKSVVTAKRMAYVRSIVRIMKSCDAKLNQLMTTQQGREMFNQAVISLMNSISNCFMNSQGSEIEVTNLLIPITQGMAVPESTSKLFADALSLWQTTCQTGDIVLVCTLDALKVQKQWTIGIYQLLNSTLMNYFRVSDLTPHHNPTWTEAYQKIGILLFNPDFSILINNDFYLACYLLSYAKISSMNDDFDRVSFLQEIQLKLAEKKSSELNESQMILMWGFLIMSGAHILSRNETSIKQLLVIARYFQVQLTQPEGWGEGLLGAIGLRRDGQTNKKKILLRCFSCVIFALFEKPENTSNSEFENAIQELKATLSNKKFADVRLEGLQAIALIESKRGNMMIGFDQTIMSLIRLFYNDSFLNSMEYFYQW